MLMRCYVATARSLIATNLSLWIKDDGPLSGMEPNYIGNVIARGINFWYPPTRVHVRSNTHVPQVSNAQAYPLGVPGYMYGDGIKRKIFETIYFIATSCEIQHVKSPNQRTAKLTLRQIRSNVKWRQQDEIYYSKIWFISKILSTPFVIVQR